MLKENRPNIVVDDNYKMFVKAMQRRYEERGAFVYTDNEAIEQERKDARARAMAPDAYRISSVAGDAVQEYRSGEKFMTTDDYLQYFSKCHDTFDAVNYYTLHKKQESEGVEEKILVNRKMVERVRAPKRAPVRRPEVRKESFTERLSEFLSEMSAARKRAMTGMAAAALSLVFVIGGVSAFGNPEPEAKYASREAEPQVIDVVEAQENENLLKG
ncbi:MAG: hypothetical protein J6D16_04105 [Clostridia bacterium]|nr:hypothetical protein [Clostridia bacterium]